jgi:hypothetical protein
VLLKVVYVLTCRVLSLAVLVFRGDLAKDAELLVLRHENAVLRRHAGRVRYEPADRAWLAALARLVPRRRWAGVLPVTPATLLARHRRLAAGKYDTSKRRKPGRPPTVPGAARLVVPNVAGILALGVYPQQWFPRYAIQLQPSRRLTIPRAAGPGTRRPSPGRSPACWSPRRPGHGLGTAWARRNFDTMIVSEPDGTVHDQPAYPLTAFRELVANALVHRDLDHWSAGRAVEVRPLTREQSVGAVQRDDVAAVRDEVG